MLPKDYAKLILVISSTWVISSSQNCISAAVKHRSWFQYNLVLSSTYMLLVMRRLTGPKVKDMAIILPVTLAKDCTVSKLLLTATNRCDFRDKISSCCTRMWPCARSKLSSSHFQEAFCDSSHMHAFGSMFNWACPSQIPSNFLTGNCPTLNRHLHLQDKEGLISLDYASILLVAANSCSQTIGQYSKYKEF